MGLMGVSSFFAFSFLSIMTCGCQPAPSTLWKIAQFLDTRPFSWALDVASVLNPLGSIDDLGSCKRSKKSSLMPSKPCYLNCPWVAWVGS